MATNPLRKLIEPRLPPAAVGLAAEGLGIVSLERRREVFAVRRAGYVTLPEGLVHPHFDEPNIRSASELTETLAQLVTSVGLLKQHRWSVALPELATRTSILTLENTPSSRAELEEMLRWKIERAIAAPLDELRVSRHRLAHSATGGARYLVTAMRLSVLAEYESLFASLGWRAGLILPRHMGEAWWLMRDAASYSDALLVSAHTEGFTAVLLRGGQPLLVRNVICEAEGLADELYRFLLFYRDRLTVSPLSEGINEHGGTPSVPHERLITDTIDRLLITGVGLDSHTASATIAETLARTPRTLEAGDVKLAFPDNDLDFNTLAAPAGLAALAWS